MLTIRKPDRHHPAIDHAHAIISFFVMPMLYVLGDDAERIEKGGLRHLERNTMFR